MGWEAVEKAVKSAEGQAWDGCHKIYLLMDEDAVAEQKSYDYEVLPPDLGQLDNWFAVGCGLEFISAIKGSGEDSEYTTLIEQFEFDRDEDEDEDEDW